MLHSTFRPTRKERVTMSWAISTIVILVVVLLVLSNLAGVRRRLFVSASILLLVAGVVLAMIYFNISLPKLPSGSLVVDFAKLLSGNIWLDGSTLFFVGTTLFLWGVRLAVVIEHRWFYTDQSYDRYHKQGCWLPLRWTATGIGFLLICIEAAAYLARLPR